MSGVRPLGGRVKDTTAESMVVEHDETHLTTYLFGPERAGERGVWADCGCGERWQLKGDGVASALYLKALHEQDPWGARFIQVLSAHDVDCASPGRETLAFTAYIGDGLMVGLIDPTQQARNTSVHRSWQYGVQVCGIDGDVIRTHGMYLSGYTALFVAVAEVASLTGNLTILGDPLGWDQ